MDKNSIRRKNSRGANYLKKKKKFARAVKTLIKRKSRGWAPALWEAKVGGSPEVRSLSPVWPRWQNPVSTKNTKIS